MGDLRGVFNVPILGPMGAFNVPIKKKGGHSMYPPLWRTAISSKKGDIQCTHFSGRGAFITPPMGAFITPYFCESSSTKRLPG